MSLGDFSTVIEMKDGFSTLPRVEELVSVMQKQKDCGLNMVDGATRQWSTIAGTLAATENTDCLHHFVKLNGPTFLNQWLLECQNSDKSVSGNSIEGLISVLLTTLEKLPLDREKLIYSGIGVTVERLLGHRNTNIKEKAKSLMEKWNYTRTISCDNLNNEDTSLNNEDTSLNNLPKSVADVNTIGEAPLTHPLLSISPGRGIDETSREVEITYASSQLDTSKGVDNSVSEPLTHAVLSKQLGENATLGDVNALCSSTISGSCPEKPVAEESPVNRGTDDDQQDISVLRKVSGGMEETEVEANTKRDSPSKSSREESSNRSSSSSDLSTSSVGDSRGFMFPSGSPQAEEIDQMDNNSGLGVEYEEIDALEMARQVALEVEREVVDYREPFCSSPEIESGDSADIHLSPEDEQNQPQPLTDNIINNMLLVEKDPSDDGSSPKNREVLVPEKTTMPGPRVHEQVLEPQGPAFKLDKKPLDFDLNDDVCIEGGPDCSTNPIPISTANISAPKAVVALSRGALCLPLKPLQFNGEMGWKGSAATSAFRPASSCIKTCPGLNHQKQNFLEIDLNVADTENDVAIDLLSAKQMPLSPNLPSVESSVEVSSRRAERLKLDLNLNRLGDEDISTNQSLYWRLHHQNGDQGLSSASSSSSQQHSMRDIDLNDNPCFIEVCGSRNLDNSSSKASTTTYGSSKLNDPGIGIMGSRLNDPGVSIMGSRLNDHGITIMGSRMAVDRKDYLNNQAHQPFMGNGMHMETMTTTRPVLPYPHMPTFYPYNGHPVGPTMPIHPSYYGPPGIPYMVDPRGATFIPQMLGPVGLNGAHYARPPFIMSLTGAPSGVVPSRSGWDLNSGIASVDGGSRDGGSFKQPFMHRHNGLMEESFKQPFAHGHMEEQARISSQSSSPSMSVKRKEPDCGWESYGLGYKHMTSRQHFLSYLSIYVVLQKFRK